MIGQWEWDLECYIFEPITNCIFLNSPPAIATGTTATRRKSQGQNLSVFTVCYLFPRLLYLSVFLFILLALCLISLLNVRNENGRWKVRIMTIKCPWIELDIVRTSFGPSKLSDNASHSRWVHAKELVKWWKRGGGLCQKQWGIDLHMSARSYLIFRLVLLLVPSSLFINEEEEVLSAAVCRSTKEAGSGRSCFCNPKGG